MKTSARTSRRVREENTKPHIQSLEHGSLRAAYSIDSSTANLSGCHWRNGAGSNGSVTAGFSWRSRRSAAFMPLRRPYSEGLWNLPPRWNGRAVKRHKCRAPHAGPARRPWTIPAVTDLLRLLNACFRTFGHYMIMAKPSPRLDGRLSKSIPTEVGFQPGRSSVVPLGGFESFNMGVGERDVALLQMP